jgi:Zn-dependent protease with chaperone function
LSNIASIPLFTIALSLVGLVSQPLVNAYTRSVEHEADTFGLEVTHLNDAAARAFIKLGSQNKSNPDPPRVVEWFQYSHPPLLERVRYAIEYHPWTEGKPNQKFRPAQ